MATPQPPGPAAASDGRMLVACFCADWCTACRAYREVFEHAAAAFPELRFLWVDVEDSAGLLDPVEVENFPTLLIGDGLRPRFFGAITPHSEVLLGLLAANRAGKILHESASSAVVELLQRLQGAADSPRTRAGS